MLAPDEASRPDARELLRRPIFKARLAHYNITLPAPEEDDDQCYSTVVSSSLKM